MVTSTPILAEAARQLARVLIDEVQILNVAPEPVTVGFEVTRPVTPVGAPVAALVQTTTLANAAESKVESIYSVKFHQGTVVASGQAIRVTRCTQEPDLVGKVLLLDKVSQNGGSIIRKAVASDFENINQEGKEGLA